MTKGMTNDTIKGKAWKKRVSNPSYAEGYDRIFGKKESEESSSVEEHPCTNCGVDNWMRSIWCICDEKLDWDLTHKRGEEE